MSTRTLAEIIDSIGVGKIIESRAQTVVKFLEYADAIKLFLGSIMSKTAGDRSIARSRDAFSNRYAGESRRREGRKKLLRQHRECVSRDSEDTDFTRDTLMPWASESCTFYKSLNKFSIVVPLLSSLPFDNLTNFRRITKAVSFATTVTRTRAEFFRIL